ncbi:MAG: penicillin-binding transpeptidase domain-containing protein [Myxococcota bacterium]|nr:penicillin-binding transpeptidase domain-containing protein [Myxococcota bacterium]
MRTLAVTTASLLGILWVALGVQDVDVLWGLSKAATAPKKVEVAKEQKPKVSLDALDPKLEKQLEQMLSNYGVEYGAVTIIDVPSGGVLAAAGSSRREPEQGRALAFAPRYPSASVFKVVAGAGLLEQPSFDSGACVAYRGGRRRVNAKLLIPRRGEGRCANLEGMLARSVNVAIARSVKSHVSRDDLVDVSRRMGFGAVFPGADAFGVSTADLPLDDDARAISAAGFGNHRISPYHAASMMAMIARGGRWGAQRPAGVPDQALSPKLARKLGQMMIATTKKGTARKTLGRIRGVDIAGKTGSLIVDGLDYSWFAGYAPADDPRIAFAAVVVNDPQKLWHIRGTHLAKAAAKGALFGDTPPRAQSLVAMR